MAKVVIEENQIDKYLRLKKEQLETNWNAKGKVKFYSSYTDNGMNLILTVNGKYRKILGTTCHIFKPYTENIQHITNRMEKLITDEIIKLFFNKKSN